MSKGWVSIHRKLQKHWLWQSDKPFDKRAAWIDLLLMVNHKPGKVYFNTEVVEVDRGERITSEVKLAERWGWSRTKVRNFLELLEKDSMIKNIKEGRKRTRIIVCNYNDYQNCENNEKTTEKQEENKGRTRGEQGSNINNNDNNENNDNNLEVVVEGPDKISEMYMNVFGQMPTQYHYKSLETYQDKGMDQEVILLALKQAGDNNADSLSYVKKILNTWHKKDITTLKEAKMAVQEFKNKKGGKSNGKKKVQGGSAPEANRSRESIFRS